MRITCPNCAAQYEVPPDAIPPEGREVQCSACGHGWIATGPGQGASEDPAPDAALRPDTAAAATGGSGLAGAASPADGAEPTAPSPPAPPRRDLDPGVLEVLRAEAEREARAREVEAAARKAAETAAATARREARLAAAVQAADGRPAPAAPDGARAGAADATAAGAADGAAAGAPSPTGRDGGARKRLPDIEEVDSALAPAPAASDAVEALPAGAESGRRGFRIGFFAVVGLAALALGIYLYARSMEAPPPLLAAYVAAFDRGHVALAEGLDALMRRLTDLIASGSA